MRVRPESITHLVVKLFNVKSKFDYIDENKQKSEIANNDKFEKRNEVMMPVIFKHFVGPRSDAKKFKSDLVNFCSMVRYRR